MATDVSWLQGELVYEFSIGISILISDILSRQSDAVLLVMGQCPHSALFHLSVLAERLP